MYIGLHVKYPLFLSDLNFSRKIFEDYPITKFNDNSSYDNRVVPMWPDGPTDKEA
jgi:hypothetical protein